MTRRQVVRVFATAACVAVLAGCSVSVFAGDSSVEYRSAWSSGWESVREAQAPYLRSDDSPGVCNKGGSVAGCLATDKTVIAALDNLRSELMGVDVPAQYQNAHEQNIAALAAMAEALRTRVQALETNSDTLFKQSKGAIEAATEQFVDAYASFPDADRPQPPPSV